MRVEGRSGQSGGRTVAGLDGGGFGGLNQSGQILGHPLQDALLLDPLLKKFPDEFALVIGILPHGKEGGGDAGEVFVEIRHVIDERQRAGIMHEAKAGNIAK